MLDMQRDNLEVDIYNTKQQLGYQKKIKSSAPPEQQSEMGKMLAQANKQLKNLKKQLNIAIIYL